MGKATIIIADNSDGASIQIGLSLDNDENKAAEGANGGQAAFIASALVEAIQNSDLVNMLYAGDLSSGPDLASARRAAKNYHDLLIKYIAYVRESGGVDFVTSGSHFNAPPEGWAMEDWRELHLAALETKEPN